MMKKINIIQIFFLLSLIITICLINTTYAKYAENINPNLHVTLNQWLIKVNEQDIMGEESFENILAMQLNNDNDNINENVLVPASTGYMEYIIDYENVGVNFDINIEIQGIENIIQDIEVYGYSIDDGEIVETSNEDIIFENSGGKAIFQEKISLLDGKTNQKIKLYLKWNDKEENNNKSKNEGLGGIFDLISGFDADKIQEGLNGMKKILAVLGELSKPEEQDVFDARSTKRPYQRNDD